MIILDGNTVTCCENSGVKDQSGNELRLCSAIDKERVQADEEKIAKNTANITLVGCVGSLSKKYEFSEYNPSCHFVGDPSIGQRRCVCSAENKLKSAPKYIKLNLVGYCYGDNAHGGTRLDGPICGGSNTIGWDDIHCRVQNDVYSVPSDIQLSAINSATGHKYRLKYIDKTATITKYEGIGTGDYRHNENCTKQTGILKGYYILERED